MALRKWNTSTGRRWNAPNRRRSNTQMDNDVTPVYLAAQEGHLEVLKFLVLEAGGSLYVRAKDGMAPVHAAAQMGCLTCLKWMIQDQGVDTNLKDGDGATPLHFASSRGHVETVRWLLRHGARLTLDKYGKSPINDAAENQQMECLNILVQHGTTPDYPDERLANGKFHGCTCRKGDPQERCSYPDCVNYSSPREPFFLHPRPESPPSPGHDGLYINPMNHNNDNSSVSSNGSESFFLHNPNELVYTRVKDLFDGSNRKHCSENPPCNTLTGLTVKVEVHSSSSGAGSEENLSSSDLSDRSAEQDHDYEDIYHIREGNRTNRNNTKCGRSRSRDSGSHSRSGSISSTNSGGIIMKLAPHPVEKDGQDEPSMTPSTESGVSSASPSDLGGSEEENDKSKVSHCRTLPYQNNFNSRQLKRVVSEPGSIYPPPPPPLPPTDPVEHSQLSRRSSCNTSRNDEDGILKPSDLRRDNVAGGKSSDVGDDGEGVTGVHVNKHMVLPFIPPKFTSNGDDCLIKPSEYLKSIGSRVVAPSAKVVDKSEVEKSDVKVIIGSETCPPPPPLPERQEAADETKVKKIQQPLSSISIHDINSVQLRRTEKTAVNKTMSAPQKSFNTTPQEPFQAQKQDLIAELKMSRDIEGVKKMKVERAKSEEKQEKELVTEIAKQLTANTMLEQIPEKDGAGNPIPPWKRQMMAKKAAEKARKELEEQLQKEAEEKRLQAIPAWKRQLLAKKEENDSKIQIYTPKIADEKKTPPVLLKVNNPEINPAMMDNSAEENDKENNRPNKESEEEGDEEEPVHIIPWRAQLRKTNSKLNLLD